MNYFRKIKTVLFILPLIALFAVSCKVSDSDNNPSGNPVNVGVIDIDALLFGNACQVGTVIVNTEAIPDGTEVEFGENSSSICLVGPDVVIDSDGIATAGVITDYFVGPGLISEIPLTIQFLLDNGTTLDQFSTVDIIGIGFIPPAGGEEGFDVEAPAEDDMDPAEPIPFIFDQVGLIAPSCDPIMITVSESNEMLGTAEAFIQPDGTILVEYTPVNGTEGLNIITISTDLTTDPAIQAACPPGTVSDGVTVFASININQTAAESGMMDAMEMECMNSIDDDGDGMVDCADDDCMGDPVCESPEMTCDDGFDNDANGMIDCLDPNCTLDPACETGDAECSDGMENDVPSDSAVDCLDDGCDGFDGENGDGTGASCEFGTEVTCDDGFNNDGDLGADCADPDDCPDMAPAANVCTADENMQVVCDDGFDNDGDGDIDCADSECIGLMGADTGICEPAGETTCDDGFDNDGMDGADCMDADGDCEGQTCAVGMTCTGAVCS